MVSNLNAGLFAMGAFALGAVLGGLFENSIFGRDDLHRRPYAGYFDPRYGGINGGGIDIRPAGGATVHTSVVPKLNNHLDGVLVELMEVPIEVTTNRSEFWLVHPTTKAPLIRLPPGLSVLTFKFELTLDANADTAGSGSLSVEIPGLPTQTNWPMDYSNYSYNDPNQSVEYDQASTRALHRLAIDFHGALTSIAYQWK